MESAQTLPAEKKNEVPPVLSQDAVSTILWDCAWEALTRAFLIQVLGSVAISLLGDVFREMTPSAPPIGVKPEADVRSWSVSHGLRAFVSHNHFWILFSVVFLAIAASRFAPHLRDPEHRKFAALVLRINRRITCNWFSLFVLNAFTAWISTIVFVAVQHFSWTQVLWSWISAVIHPLFQSLANAVPGAGSVGRWYAWYGQNQAKFLFWLLYSAAICDDLGLPNYKTLIRWGARRLRVYVRKRWATDITQSAKSSASGQAMMAEPTKRR
jgi:hypothetical protein